jgi:hypothetical protein
VTHFEYIQEKNPELMQKGKKKKTITKARPKPIVNKCHSKPKMERRCNAQKGESNETQGINPGSMLDSNLDPFIGKPVAFDLSGSTEKQLIV